MREPDLDDEFAYYIRSVDHPEAEVTVEPAPERPSRGYRIGYAIGVAIAAALGLGLLTLIVIGVVTVLR